MHSARPQLIATEENSKLPILIIDKNGVIGAALADLLKEQFLIVFVSKTEQQLHKNIIHIPYRRKIPVIPDNAYSHVFVFYNGENETLSILPSLVRKANESLGKIQLLTPLSAASPDLDKRLSHHLYHSMPTIIYGEVFDSKLQIPNLVNYFIYQARKLGRLEIPNEGMGSLYPVHLDDLLAVIVAIAFSHENKKGCHFAFPRTPFTEMSVARIFQRIDPEIKFDFINKKIKTPNYHISQDGEYIFKKYNLEHGLRKAFRADETNDRIIGQRLLTIKQSKRDLDFKKFFLIIFAAFIAPIVMIAVSALLGSALLSFSADSGADGKFESALRYSSGAYSSFAFSKNLTDGYFPADYIAPNMKSVLIDRVEAGENAAIIGKSLFTTLSSYTDIYDNKHDADKRFIASLPDTKNALILLEEMRAEKALPSFVSEKIDDRGFLLTHFQNTIDFLPNLLGFEGERSYLLLFQNNMEIRPSGGFIGSYGLLSVEGGKFEKIEIHDVYDADGKLTTHIEPPYGLRRFAGASHWFLRDSNFSIQGSTNAAAAADLFSRSTGEEVDGVMMVNTEFIKNILEGVGPVEVTDYKDTVNAENFYLLTQKHAEEDFFPGSTQKKDFLRSLYASLLTKLAEDKANSAKILLAVFEKSIKERHLMFVPFESRAQKVFIASNLSGDIVDERERDENKLIDFLAVMDANIGANKGDYYVNRSISHIATISDTGQLFGEAVVTFENTSKADSIFGGIYKNYMRIVLPEGSDLRAVVIDDRQAGLIDAVTNPAVFTAPGFVAPLGLEIERGKIGDKQVFAFLVEVPVETSKKIAINYAIPQAVDINAPSAVYDLRVVKQPGTVDDPYQLILNYPSKFTPVELSEGVVDLGGKLRFEIALRTDQNIEIKFSQK